MALLEQKFALKDKAVVISGGGGVLCGAIAEGFVQAGAKIILWDIRKEAMDNKAAQIIQRIGPKTEIFCVKVDLMKEEEIIEALKKSINKFGKVDILLNGAGGNNIKCPLTEVEQKDFDFVIKLNLYAGCIFPTKHVANYWIENKIKGTIINIASMAGLNPLSGVWAYSAAKAAVINQTMAHAKALAKYGIRVNAIAPGFFVADQNRRLLLNEDGTLTQRGKDVIAHTPMQRFGEPEDLVAPAIFLASEGSTFVSGITLPVDGAYLCQNI